jgi:hypothetical protein
LNSQNQSLSTQNQRFNEENCHFQELLSSAAKFIFKLGMKPFQKTEEISEEELKTVTACLQ